MPTFDAYPPGTPCWVDLQSPDVDASKAFYGRVFGWEAEDIHDDEGTRVYTNLSLHGQLVCGLGGQQPGMDGMPAIWTTYIATAEVNATAAAVTAAGGSVMMPPMQVMEAGHMAIFADPAGAVFAVWQPNQHVGAQVANEPNTWSWNELNTRDLDAALPFYSAVFGWEYDTQEMPDGTYNVIKGGESGGLGGLMAMPPGVPEQAPNHWMVYFTVADLAASVEAVKAAGGGTMTDAMSVPGVGTMAVIHDPHGGSFSLLQPETAG